MGNTHYCRAYSCAFGIPIARQDKALLTRDDAIGTSQEGSYVLVVGPDNVVQRKIVKTGQRQGQLRIIESGLEPGDWVMTEGVQRVFPGAKVEPQRSELTSIAADPSNPPRRASPVRHRNETALVADMISRFFIDRPVLANVLALVFVLIGPGLSVAVADRPISQCRAADHTGENAVSGRERQDPD